MEEIVIDYSNPFLYVGGIATISLITNVYCACKYRWRRNNIDESEVELTSSNYVVNDKNVEDGFVTTNKIIETKDASTTMKLDTVIEVRDKEEEPKNVTTQTEDCELYKMMGQRFNEELDFYKNAVINKKKGNKRIV